MSSKSFRHFTRKQQFLRHGHSENEKCAEDGCWEYAPFGGGGKGGGAGQLCLNHYLRQLQALRKRAYTPGSEKKTAGDEKRESIFSADALLGAAGRGLDNTSKRRRLVFEILSSEESYVQTLDCAARYLRFLRAYSERKRAVLANDEFEALFANLEAVLELHRQVLGDLGTLQADHKLVTPALGELFVRVAPFFRMYTTYVVNYETVPAAMAKCMKQPKFAAFVDLHNAGEAQTLSSLLIAPVQRLPRYLMLLRGVEETSDDGKHHKMLSSVREALDRLTAITSEVNEEFRRREARERVVTIQSLMHERVTLVTPTRYHVHDGTLRKKYGSRWTVRHSRACYVFLFSDLAVYASPPSRGNSKVHYQGSMPLRTASVAVLPPSEKVKKGCEHGFVLRGRPKDLTFYAGSEEDRDQWVKLLAERIRVVKMNMSTLRVSVIAEDAAEDAAAASRMQAGASRRSVEH